MAEKVSGEEHELGELVREYRADPVHLLHGVVFFLTWFLAGLCLLWLAPPLPPPNSPLVTVAVVLLLLLFGGGGLWHVISMARLRMRLFEQGFVHAKGRVIKSFRWEEIETVDLSQLTNLPDVYGTKRFFRFRTAGGQEVVLDVGAIIGAEDLGRTVMREVRHSQLKGLLRRALSLEAAGAWGAALAAFEQLLSESPYNAIADHARDHIRRCREQNSAHLPGDDGIRDSGP
jgi:hypothetical protein